MREFSETQLLYEWGYGPMSISILKLSQFLSVCQSFVTLRRAIYENGALGEKEKITAAKHAVTPLYQRQPLIVLTKQTVLFRG